MENLSLISMKHFKHLLFTLLALILIIRPVFAEGLMVHTGSEMAVETVQTIDLMAHSEHCQTMTLHGSVQSDIKHSIGHSIGCTNAGLHQCDGNCMDNSCSFISAASAITSAENQKRFNIEQSQMYTFNHVPLLVRPIPPEQRPPNV